MKHQVKNLELVSGKMKFKVESICTEYNLDELVQFATNTTSIVNCFKEAIAELTPILATEMAKYAQLRHVQALEIMESESIHSS